MEINSKCAKVDADFSKSLIYIIPKKIQKRRLDILLTKSREKSLPITDTFRYVCMSRLQSVWLNTAKDPQRTAKDPQRTAKDHKRPTKDRKGALRAKLQEIGTN